MHSLKNTVIAILLLGVSYGVYQVITTPDPLTTADQNLIDPLEIDDGLATTFPTENSANSEIQLPAAAAPSASFAANPNQAPPKFDQPATFPASDKSSPDPTAESLVNRQAKLDFAVEPGMGGQQTSAEIEVGDKNFARDQELIDALKDQLESNDEADLMQSDFAPSPADQPVSVKANPDATPPSLFGNQPASDSFAPVTPAVAPALPTGAAPEAGSASVKPVNEVWPAVESMAETGQFRTALETLTPYFGDPDMPEVQRQRLMGWLDALAGKVIYSTEHNLYEPYVVQANESLDDIANRWNVTSQLVYNINQAKIANLADLPAGTELKKVQGPFHAEIDLTKKVMTLFVDNLYAGRFTVQVDDNPTIEAGQYGVQQKNANGTTADGQPASHMITLDEGVCIQASSETNSSPTCIGLTPKDAADLFIIFTEQSQFFIKR